MKNATELLRRGLECGIFDDAPNYKRDVKALLKKPEEVEIIVSGGIAYVTACPENVKVNIVDQDLERR
jgi:hypothetical protein